MYIVNKPKFFSPKEALLYTFAIPSLYLDQRLDNIGWMYVWVMQPYTEATYTP